MGIIVAASSIRREKEEQARGVGCSSCQVFSLSSIKVNGQTGKPRYPQELSDSLTLYGIKWSYYHLLLTYSYAYAFLSKFHNRIISSHSLSDSIWFAPEAASFCDTICRPFRTGNCYLKRGVRTWQSSTLHRRTTTTKRISNDNAGTTTTSSESSGSVIGQTHHLDELSTREGFCMWELSNPIALL